MAYQAVGAFFVAVVYRFAFISSTCLPACSVSLALITVKRSSSRRRVRINLAYADHIHAVIDLG